jgi:hemicentin
VTGDPRPEVEWKKDSFKIDFFNMEHKYFMKGLGSLVIPKVDIRDTARYLCIAENAAGVVTQEINLIVHEPPTIPEDAETEFDIIANNRITLPCSAKGTPAPKIKWYKDGEIITGNEAGMKISPDGSLQIENPRGTNAGRYKCVAENVAGSVSHYINLQVYLPPRFGEDDDYEDETDQPTETMQVIQNETVRMLCPVHAIPTPQITWYKNGEEVIEEYLEDRVKILNGGQELEISSSDIDDTARYTCVARNLAGETEKNFDLDVFVPPTINDETATKLNISVIASRPVSIECPAFGVPLPDIVWFKDDQEIYPEHNHDLQILGNGRRLEISSADIADTGRYKCVAKNTAGMIEREYNLHVWIPARIDSSDTISNPEVIVNQTIILHCPASGVPEPDVEWFRDDEPVDEDIHDIKILDRGWRLKIKNAEMSHTGRYTCVAKNIAGESEKIYDLNVLVVPYIERADVVLSPKVIINKTVVINCPAGGIPLPEIVWQKNGENLDPVLHPNIQVMSGGRQLRITSAAISDSGRYRCIATNKAGNDNLDFQLSVHIPVSIDRSKLDHYPTVIVNQSKILECPVIGIPPPKITWFMNSEPIEFENMPHISLRNEGRKLEIISAQVSDIGLYECLVENEAGTDQVSYDLKVFVPPTINLFTSTTSNPDIVIGQTVVINCHVDGVSQPRIQWLHNGQPLDESSSRYRILDDGQQLEIFQTEVEDAGRYTCIAKNEAGIVDRDFDLNVLVPPTIDSTNLELRPKVIKGKVITLNCPVQGIPFPNITWLKDDEPVIESEKIRYLLTGRQLEISIAEESDSAKYTCSATNIAGQAEKILICRF